jgi:hypothetical protein
MRKAIFFTVLAILYILMWGPLGWGALTEQTLAFEPKATEEVSIESSRMAKGLICTVILGIGILGPLMITGWAMFIFGATNATITKVEDILQRK